MENTNKTTITVEIEINAPAEKVQQYWTKPEHVLKWNYASEDWQTTQAENDLRVGGRFLSRMEAKDGSFGFDFEGTYDSIILYKLITYTIGDGRKVRVTFIKDGNSTRIIENFETERVTFIRDGNSTRKIEYFETENANPVELQGGGWQSILNNFKKYTEVH